MFCKVKKNLLTNYVGISPLPTKKAGNFAFGYTEHAFGDALQILVSENFLNVHKIKRHEGTRHSGVHL